MEAIKTTAQCTMQAVQFWINENNFDYDSIVIKAYDSNNSPSGTIFTAWAKEKNKTIDDREQGCVHPFENVISIGTAHNCTKCGKDIKL